MNRYEVFRLVQELGQLIEDAHDKTPEEVACELIACGQRKLTEARGALDQPANGTAISLPSVEVSVTPELESTVPSVATSVPTGTVEA